MASEPKKPIEQMLEALAKARRAQFGDEPKMPNPMRARLHEEVARTAANEKTEPRPSWITMFWSRVTVAAALATLLVLVPAIWWNQSHPVAGSGTLALRDRATSGAARELNPAVPAKNTLANVPATSASKPTVNLADNSQIKIEPARTASSEAEALASSSGVQQGRATTEFPSQEAKGFDKEIAAAKIQAPAAAPPAGADSKAKSEAMAGAGPPVAQPSSAGNVAMAQQFSQQSAVQSFRNNAQQVSRSANVLNTFQVQQQGNEIRVIDSDGSTYTGKIEQSAKSAEPDSRIAARRDVAKQMPRYTAKAVGENKPAIPQSYFHATGYNVSLKRTLVFEGNYAAPSEQQPASTSNDRERAESNRDRARIVGTVRVNGEAPVQVDAIAETSEPGAAKKSEK